MRIHRTFTVNAPPDKVWDVLGHRFDEVDRWASSISRSTARTNGVVIDGAPMAGRACETDIGNFRESITEFDEERRVVAYDAVGEKMPFFVRKLANHWTVLPAPGGKSTIEMRMSGDLKAPFSFVMGPMMKLQLGGVINKIIEELTYFLEHDQPHPRKAAS